MGNSKSNIGMIFITHPGCLGICRQRCKKDCASRQNIPAYLNNWKIKTHPSQSGELLLVGKGAGLFDEKKVTTDEATARATAPFIVRNKLSR